MRRRDQASGLTMRAPAQPSSRNRSGVEEKTISYAVSSKGGSAGLPRKG